MSQVISYIIFSQLWELKDVPNSSANCIILKRPDMLKQLKKDVKGRNIIYTKQEIDDIYNKLLLLHRLRKSKRSSI
ncbi:hypothetical protein [Clostridium sp. OS1-26]|uniref:hypothetical protein n=1 Tax=Clostridium sp. OS1-26 TaxID=3070681 RepID=UPI0027E08347|nr:hypothetical protein [Clostridium sp. OS1-26]WML34335.1 hypothetical protein RCG18_24070 [Clostridium sp. OS1-26]